MKSKRNEIADVLTKSFSAAPFARTTQPKSNSISNQLQWEMKTIIVAEWHGMACVCAPVVAAVNAQCAFS